MTRLLHLDSSARSGSSEISRHGSHTRRLSARFVQRWLEHEPDAQVVYRDIGAEPPAPVDGRWVHAAFTPPAQREPWMHDRLAQSDAVIDELLAADVIVAGVPMYNFGMPAQLKAWLDAVTRARVTFRYTEQGPVGLLTGKRVYVAHARGGRYRGTALDHVTPQLDTHLGFIGLGDVRHVYAEGFAMGDEARAAGLADAARQLAALFDEAADAVAA